MTFPKASEDATEMAGCTPVPESEIEDGDPGALCVSVSEAERVPVSAGVKETVMF